MAENLLCDESWLLAHPSPESSRGFRCTSSDEDVDNTVEEAISMDLEKELVYMPINEYVELLVSKDLTHARFRAIRWFIKSRERLNLSFETLFSAANCLDRFISASSIEDWKYWMVELLSVACLSTASKFNDVAYPSLQEIQIEGLDHTFHPSKIQQMELILLKALGWRISTITIYSFSQMILSKSGFSKYFLDEEAIRGRVIDQLQEDLSDYKMSEYPPSVVGLSAVCKVLEDMGGAFPAAAIRDRLECMMSLLGKERKEKVVKCVARMRSRQMEIMTTRDGSGGPESPVTVLLMKDRDQQSINVKDDRFHHVDLSLFRIVGSNDESKKKRDRESYEEKLV